MYSARGEMSKAGEQNENQLLNNSVHSHSPHAALSRLILYKPLNSGLHSEKGFIKVTALVNSMFLLQMKELQSWI